ncbi:SRPBCC family protein [Pseudarthrobacter sp. J64]|uniref:SRPBCC family protein n=1 Tax=Pseudarthrobacter sp. J64 TaxID=3116485 RepID=UPI002E81954D|nr:SRPBCC family protein [Pseudarthrobacter sp. J64]MEE2568967.1 SRPBCC family protein [Pseudarthrobacter sp. J64]
MAFAEHDVLIACDAMRVYNFLLDGANLPLWRTGIRSISLASGTAGSKGAVYQQTLNGPGGRPIAADFQITQARPGAEIEFQVIAGPIRPKGGYYLSTEGAGTRVRFALDYQPKGLFSLIKGSIHRTIKDEVAQLERLRQVLEAQAAH